MLSYKYSIIRMIAIPVILFIIVWLVGVLPNTIGRTVSNAYYQIHHKLFAEESFAIDYFDKDGKPINQDKIAKDTDAAFYKDNGVYHKNLTPWEQAGGFLTVAQGTVRDGIEYNKFTEEHITRGLQAILSGNPQEIAIVEQYMKDAKTDVLMSVTPDGGAQGIKIVNGELKQFNLNPDQLENIVLKQVEKNNKI